MKEHIRAEYMTLHEQVVRNEKQILEIKSSSKALLEAVIEMVEGMKKLSDFDPPDIYESGKLVGRIKALSDLQSKLKEEINKI